MNTEVFIVYVKKPVFLEGRGGGINKWGGGGGGGLINLIDL